LADVLQNLAFFAFMVAWFGGLIALYVRTSVKQNAYLRHFRSAEGYPLDAYTYVRYSPEGRQMRRLMREPQDDPELEKLRREVWRRARYCLIWMFGCPALFVGVSVTLILLLWHPPQ
jgi:hypothetical protein